MARIVGVTLCWEAPVADTTVLTGREGICMVIAGRKRSDGNWDDVAWRLLDLGQWPDTDGNFAAERKDNWQQVQPADCDLLFKFAEMPLRKFDATDRLIVEACLRHHHPPALTGGAVRPYRRGDLVVIANTGQSAPLAHRYSCDAGC